MDLDDLLPLDDLPELVGDEFDSVFSAVVDVLVSADEVLSALDFFFRFLPSTVVGSTINVVAMAVMMRSGDENFILLLYSIYMQRLKR